MPPPMFPALSPDDEAFRARSIEFIESACTLPRVRALIDNPVGVDRGYLRAAGAVGWFSAFVDEARTAPAVTRAALIAFERGRALQPGPFIGITLAVRALVDAGTPAQRADVLPALVAGEATAAWAVTAVGRTPTDITVEARASSGDGFCLSGVVPVVPDAQDADWLLVAAHVDAQPTQFLVPAHAAGLTTTPLHCFDLTARMADVELDGVTVSSDALLGEVGAAGPAVAAQFNLATLLTAIDAVGAMDALFEMTRTYSLERTAFGRPIGSYQALKHRMADMSLLVETSKALGVVTTDAVEHCRDLDGEQVSLTKAYVGDAAIEVSQGCLQIHGGIGYTWDHDLHLYVRRLTNGHGQYGSPDWHRDRVCAIHGLGT